jgi:hypothetical protein
MTGRDLAQAHGVWRAQKSLQAHELQNSRLRRAVPRIKRTPDGVEL